MTYLDQPEKGEADPVPDDPAFHALSLNPEQWALFLDIDGTLLDIAKTPDRIVVPPALPQHLEAVAKRLGGALALVTGRSVAFADTLFAPFHFPIAGLHGAERRDATGRLQQVQIPPEFEEMKRSIARQAEVLPGVLVEDKGAAVAVHYRLAPEYRAAVEAIMERHLGEAGPDWALQDGKMVIEIRPGRANKGHAIEAFLEDELFQHRKPFAIGDDVTDESMFKIANELGGQSLRIGAPVTETFAHASLPSPAHLRELIGRLAA